jgi:hypothetical protein
MTFIWLSYVSLFKAFLDPFDSLRMDLDNGRSGEWFTSLSRMRFEIEPRAVKRRSVWQLDTGIDVAVVRQKSYALVARPGSPCAECLPEPPPVARPRAPLGAFRQHLRLLTHFGSQFAAATPLWRCEKSRYATLAAKLHVALDRHKPHSKSARDLRLSGVAIDHKLVNIRNVASPRSLSPLKW